MGVGEWAKSQLTFDPLISPSLRGIASRVGPATTATQQGSRRLLENARRVSSAREVRIVLTLRLEAAVVDRVRKVLGARSWWGKKRKHPPRLTGLNVNIWLVDPPTWLLECSPLTRLSSAHNQAITVPGARRHLAGVPGEPLAGRKAKAAAAPVPRGKHCDPPLHCKHNTLHY